MSNGVHSSGTDDWLTPPGLIRALGGGFDLDPCCPPDMPWQTAGTMFSLPEDDGLVRPWTGRVWCNPPYSDVLPWAKRMVRHCNGIMLVSAKSTETVWAQHLLSNCDAVFFPKGRFAFHYPSGEQSKGKWLSSMLLAFGAENAAALADLPRHNFHGTLFLHPASR